MKRYAAMLSVVVLIFLFSLACSATVFVKYDSTGAVLDGQSWDTAFHKVQEGIDAASSGDEIWVAAGTYEECITLKDSVGLYGGFDGSETAHEQRDWKNNVVIIQSNLIGTKLPPPVVTAPAGTTSRTVLDGFSIINPLRDTCGIKCSQASPSIVNNTISGAGYCCIYCDTSSSLISNNTVSGTNASYGGYGIYCISSSVSIEGNTISACGYGIELVSSSSSSITANTISENQYGVYCDSSSAVITQNKVFRNSNSGFYILSCSPSIARNQITANRLKGIHCGSASPSITNNIISGNGDGVYCFYSPSLIINNTISGNGHSGIYCEGSSPSITNNIVAFNSKGVDNSGGNGTPVLNNNCVYNPDGENYVDLTAGTNDCQLDPKFASAEYGHLHIQPDSPCVDRGLGNAVQPGWTDIDSQPRVQEEQVDIGADESDGTLWPAYQPTIIRVSKDGVDDDLHDGSSWALAKKTVKAGIDTVFPTGGEVWIAAGEYAEQVALPAYVSIYGGFLSSESLRSERNWVDNRCVLNSGGAGTVVTAMGGYRLSRIDGFSIINEWMPKPDTSGIDCDHSSTFIEHNTIYGNFYGIYSHFCSPLIANNIITGSFYGIYSPSATPSVINNTILGNGRSGIYWCYTGSPSIMNNIVALNAIGISSDGGGAPVIKNNCVYNPTGTNYAGFADPTGISGNITSDPKLVSPAYGQCHIQPDSPCIDTGLDAAVGVDWSDLDCRARVQGTHVDIGADESDQTVWPEFLPNVIRVSPNGSDDAAHDGSNWSLAKKTLQAGIDAVSKTGGELWIATGTYAERVLLPPYVYMYGGFVGTENNRDKRDWVSSSCLLDGNSEGTVVTAGLGYRISALDGFTIRNAGTSSHGIVCKNSSSPLIINDTVSGNGGCGIYCNYCSSPLIEGCTIIGNRQEGILCYDYSSPTITDSKVTENAIGISCWNSSSPSILSNVIAACPIGVNCTSSSCPTITNNLIAGGTGIGILTNSSAPAVSNNTICNSQFGVSCKDSSAPVITSNILAYNATGLSIYNSKPLLKNNDVYNPSGKNYSGLSASLGDISLDPLFADRSNGDYRLLPGSPCIDAGYVDGAPVDDLDGNTRPRDANGDGVALPDIGCYECPANYMSIASAKKLTDAAPVGIYGPVTTAVFGDRFYVETLDRQMGIGVLGGASGVGRRMSIEGTVDTIDGERVVRPTSMTDNGMAAIPAPFLMNCNSLGGGPLGKQSGVSDWRLVRKTNDLGEPFWVRDLYTYGGANNIGLLVKLTGRVTNYGSGFFYLDDAASFDDGDESNKGVRVDWPFVDDMPSAGTLVEVTGISSCRIVTDTTYGNIVVRLLRPVDANAVRPL